MWALVPIAIAALFTFAVTQMQTSTRHDERLSERARRLNDIDRELATCLQNINEVEAALGRHRDDRRDIRSHEAETTHDAHR